MIWSAYNLRHVVPIKLNVTDTFPVEVHIKLDAFIGSPVHINICKTQWYMSQIEFDKVNAGKWSRKCRCQNWINYIFCDLSSSNGDVWPQLCYKIVEESW